MPDSVNVTDFEGRDVLVTGGAGFIGSHLVEELVGRGARVTVLDDLSTGRLDNLAAVEGRYELHERNLATDDVRDVLASRRFALVVHLAANAYVPPSVESPLRDFAMNAMATLELLEAMRETRAETPLIYTSTAAVYGEGFGEPLTEGDSTEPVAPYAVSKLCAERYVAIYPKVFGLRTCILRLFSTYGPRLRKQVVYDLMGKIRRNPDELPIFGDGTQQRDFNHVSNVVEALCLAAEKGRFDGDLYNVAGEEPITIQRLAELICEHMGVQPVFKYSGAVRAGEANRWTANVAKIKALGYEPRLRMSEGLADTVRWFEAEQG